MDYQRVMHDFLNEETFRRAYRTAYQRAQQDTSKSYSYRGPVTGAVTSQSKIKARAMASCDGVLAITDVEFREVE